MNQNFAHLRESLRISAIHGSVRSILCRLLTGLAISILSISAEAQEIQITGHIDDQVSELSGDYGSLAGRMGQDGVFVPKASDEIVFPEAYPIDPVPAWPKEEPTQDMIDCSKAVEEFIRQVGRGWSTNQAGVTTAKEYLEWQSDAVEDWKEHCLESDEDVFQDEFVSRGLSIEAIKASLGYFYLDAEPICSGILFEDSVVLTARHCFSTEQPSTQAFSALAECKSHPESCNLEFATYAKPRHIVQVTGTTYPTLQQGAEVFDHQDYIYIGLAAAIPSVKVVISTPTVGDRLFVGGYLPFFELEDFGNHVDRDGAVYFLPRLHWSEDLEGIDECQVELVADECVYHSCQSLNGFSGSPLIREATDEQITVVGLHIGGADRQAVCGASRASSLNRGVIPPVPSITLALEASS